MKTFEKTERARTVARELRESRAHCYPACPLCNSTRVCLLYGEKHPTPSTCDYRIGYLVYLGRGRGK